MIAIVLLLVGLCSAEVYHVTFLEPYTTFWLNCYSTDCVTWRDCPTETQETVCLKFRVDKPAFYTTEAGELAGYSPQVGDVYSIQSFKVQSSYSIPSALTQSPPARTCSAKSPVVSGQCLTPADACADPTCPTAPYFSNTADTSTLTPKYYCVASYYGYGSPYGTLCEPFAAQLSEYYSISPPAEGSQSFSDYGIQRQRKSFGCYWENWSKYRPSPYTSSYDDLIGCDKIYFFVNTLADREGNIAFVEREENDNKALSAIKSRFPTAEVYMTYGGWTSNNTIMYMAMKTLKSEYLPKILGHARQYKVGVDFDVEFPGSSNGYADIFPLDFDSIVEFMGELCTELHKDNLKCSWGGMAVGTHFFPTLYTRLHQAGVDFFNMFGYDLHGPWSQPPRQQSPLINYPSDPTKPGGGDLFDYSLQTMVTNMLAVVPPGKINIGLPLYARGFSSTGGGCPGTSYLLGPGETGVDGIATDSTGLEFPSTKSNQSIITEDPAQPGYYLMVTGTCTIPFMNSTTFQLIYDTLSAMGITNYYVYAASMNRLGARRFSSIVHSQSLLSRKRRDLVQQNGIFYVFPQNTREGVFICPGIIAYTASIIAVNVPYKGCGSVSSASRIFFCLRSTFTCQSGSTSILVDSTSATCSGLNPNTLLQSKPSDSVVVCNDLTVRRTDVTVCQQSAPTPVNTLVSIQIPSPLTTWPEVSIPIYTTWDVSYQTIKQPQLCTTFQALPTCLELLCGTNANCYEKVQSYNKTAVCGPLGLAINTYEQVIRKLRSQSQQLAKSFDELALYSTHRLGQVKSMNPFSTGQVTSVQQVVQAQSAPGMMVNMNQELLTTQAKSLRRRKRSTDYGNDIYSNGGWAILPNEDVLFQYASEAAGKINTLFSSVNNLVGSDREQWVQLQRLRDQSQDNFNQINSKFNEFQRLTAESLNQQFQVNEIFQKNFQTLQNTQQKFAEVADVKFKELQAVTQQLADQISSLQNDFSIESQLNTNVHKAISSVISASSAALETYTTITDSLALVRTCLSSTQDGRLGGCVDSGSDSVPLGVQVYNQGDLKSITYMYLTRKPLGYMRIRAVKSYCYEDAVYTAPSGCTFMYNSTKVQLVNELNLVTCQSLPIVFPVVECPVISFNITTTSPPVNFTFEVPQFNMPNNTATLIYNGTDMETLIQDLLQANLTKLHDLQQQIEQLNLTLSTLSNINPVITTPLGNFQWTATTTTIASVVGTIVVLIILVLVAVAIKLAYDKYKKNAAYSQLHNYNEMY